MGLKKLYKLVLKSFIGPFIATFFVSLFLFLLQFLWKYIGDLIGKGLEWYVIMEFIGYSAIHLIPMALPLAVLLSSIMTFGSLGEHYELVAMKSAGLSLIRIFVPMYGAILFISIFAFYASNILIPKANLSWGALLYDVSNKKPAFSIKEGVFFKDIHGYSIKIGKKLEDGKTIQDIIIYINNSGKGNNNIVLAKSGTMEMTADEKYLVLTLKDGVRYQEMIENPTYYKDFQHNVMHFKTQDISIDLSDLKFKRTKKDLFKDDYRMMNVSELDQKIDSLKRLILERQKLAYQFITPYFHFPSDTGKKYSFDSAKLKQKYHLTLGNFIELNEELNKTYTAQHEEQIKHESELKIDSNPNDVPKPFVPPAPEVVTTFSSKEDYMPEILETSKQYARSILTIIESSNKDVLSQRETQLKYEVEWHKKYTLAISCLLLFFIGAPMGAIIRRGGFGWPMVVSVILFILYFSLNLIGEKLAKGEVLPSFISVWMSTFILLPFAIILTYKANKDAKLFERGINFSWITKIPLFKRFRKKDS